MNTATLHLDHVETYGAADTIAKCFRLDPPYEDHQTGVRYEYVTAVILPGIPPHQLPQCFFVGADERGLAAGPTMKRLGQYGNQWSPSLRGLFFNAGYATDYEDDPA